MKGVNMVEYYGTYRLLKVGIIGANKESCKSYGLKNERGEK